MTAGSRRIQYERLLVRVQVGEQTASLARLAGGGERPHRTRLCAGWRLHLDDAGPEIRKQFAAILGCDPARQLKDSQIAQRGHGLPLYRSDDPLSPIGRALA